MAVSAATRCRYCALFHTEAAKLFGATDDEVEEALAGQPAGQAEELERVLDSFDRAVTHLGPVPDRSRSGMA